MIPEIKLEIKKLLKIKRKRKRNETVEGPREKAVVYREILTLHYTSFMPIIWQIGINHLVVLFISVSSYLAFRIFVIFFPTLS